MAKNKARYRFRNLLIELHNDSYFVVGSSAGQNHGKTVKELLARISNYIGSHKDNEGRDAFDREFPASLSPEEKILIKDINNWDENIGTTKEPLWVKKRA